MTYPRLPIRRLAELLTKRSEGDGSAIEPYELSREELLRLRALLTRLLTENVIPFWYPRVLDERDGGYRLNHDPIGRWRGPANKHLILQTRVLWFFSRLARSKHGKSGHLAAARHGYEFLRERMLDAQYGGFYWEVDSGGTRATDARKYILGQVYALFGLAEYARASGDPAALTLATQLFDLLEQRAHDAEFGGYLEIFERDWRDIAPDSRGYDTLRPELKRFTTHLHVMEALATYAEVDSRPIVHERLVEQIMINSNAVVRKRVGACTNRYQRDWTPLRGNGQDRITYGHDVENVWLLVEACQAARLSNGPLLDLYRTLFDYALAYGFDQERGGFYESGGFELPADRLDKVWWVQAEALLGALHLFALTGEKVYFTCFDRTLRWIAEYQADWEHGEWYATVADNGSTSGDKAGAGWKGPYHNGRALIRCLELLPSPPGS